jgi:hypothetical protein
MRATLRETHRAPAVEGARPVGPAVVLVTLEGARWPLFGSYAETLGLPAMLVQITMTLRPLSSMDRAPDFGSGGCEFESCSGYF